jgi:class 3 adenylate cyclase
MHSTSAVATFLFTDIEGSTRLWEHEPERMQPALARHDALARSAVEGHGGTIVKTTGDGIYAAFDQPLDAIDATLQPAIRKMAKICEETRTVVNNSFVPGKRPSVR